MRRFAMDKLLDWKKKSNRKPLILMGARQVGKTWLMKEFGKTYYEKTAYISFYNNQRMQAVFAKSLARSAVPSRCCNNNCTRSSSRCAIYSIVKFPLCS